MAQQAMTMRFLERRPGHLLSILSQPISSGKLTTNGRVKWASNSVETEVMLWGRELFRPENKLGESISRSEYWFQPSNSPEQSGTVANKYEKNRAFSLSRTQTYERLHRACTIGYKNSTPGPFKRRIN